QPKGGHNYMLEMRQSLRALIVGIAIVAFNAAQLNGIFAVAQEASQENKSSDKNVKNADDEPSPDRGSTKNTTKRSRTVTGCLQKGDEPNEFTITGKDGKTWGVTSKTEKLDQHLGHTVTVTGSAHRESKAEEKAEKAEAKKEGKA